DTKTPPRDAANNRASTFRERTWTWFQDLFKFSIKVGKDPILSPYDKYRDRATSLNYHYAGLYRGAFILSFTLAVLAVGLAGGSLVLLSFEKGNTSSEAEHCISGWAIALFLFAFLKLTILVSILQN